MAGLVSVAISVCNAARHLDELLAAVRAQDVDREVEIVIADAGSTDGSREIAGRYDALIESVDASGGTNIPSGMNVNKTMWLGSMLNNSWNSWPGQIDDVQTYNRVLTIAEVQHIYNTGTNARAGWSSENEGDDQEITSLKVYPNPSKGSVTVEGKGELKIFEVNGRVYFSERIDGKTPIGQMHPGFYLIQLKTKDHILIKKLVIE